jgi:hypothetical protein
MSEPRFEELVAVYRVTERRDGAIYRTQFLGNRWVPSPAKPTEPDLIYTAPSSDTPGRWIRRATTTQ